MQRDWRGQPFPLSHTLIISKETEAPTSSGILTVGNFFKGPHTSYWENRGNLFFPQLSGLPLKKSLELTLIPGSAVSSTSISKIGMFRNISGFPSQKVERSQNFKPFFFYFLCNLPGDRFSTSCLIHL